MRFVGSVQVSETIVRRKERMRVAFMVVCWMDCSPRREI